MRDDQVPMSPLQRLQARLVTGPVGHLLGGALDVLSALARHNFGRAVRALRARLRRAP